MISFLSWDGGRSVMIYARVGLDVSENYQSNLLYHDASSCNWDCEDVTIIIGSFYRSFYIKDNVGQRLNLIISKTYTMCYKLLIT